MVSENDYILKFAGDKKTAQKLGAFYTPPSLGRRMVDKVSQSFAGKKCLDNCCGYGNLILQMLDAKVRQGEDPTQALTEVYGNEFDLDNLKICMRNLKVWAKLNGAKWINAVMNAHFHTGDALTAEAYAFEDPKIDLESAPDENDIETALSSERKDQAVVPAEKPNAVSDCPKRPERDLKQKKSDKNKPKQVEQKKSAVFTLYGDRFDIECCGKKTSRKGVGSKFCRTVISALAALKSKNIVITASKDTVQRWQTLLSLHDLSCDCELVQI